MVDIPTPAAPASLSMVLGTRELSELILSKLALIDLAAAHGSIKDFNTSIEDPQTKALKQALFLIRTPASEYVIWKHHHELQDPWQPHVGKKAGSFRDRPITIVNPVMEHFRVHKWTSSHRLEGWQDIEMYFNADALLAFVKDDTIWDKTLLTKTGQMDVELDVVVDNGWKEHVPEGYDDEWGCVPLEDLDLEGRSDDGQDDEEDEDDGNGDGDDEVYDEASSEQANNETNEALEDEEGLDTYPEEKEHLTTTVSAAEEGVGVTVADLKSAIRSLRSTKYKGPWIEGHHARLTIRGCVVESARCVEIARTWAAGTLRARGYPNGRELSDEK